MDKPTTTIILDKDEITALLAAIADSSDKCEFFINSPAEEIAQYIKHLNLGPVEETEHISKMRSSASSLLSHFVPLAQELQEAYYELAEQEKGQEPGKIIGLDKKPLN